MKLQDIHKEVLAWCASDDTGIWDIVRIINKDSHSINVAPDWVRAKTIETIRYLLINGLVEAGNPNGVYFQPISSSVEDTIVYITKEWDRIGRIPRLGDICWFRATPSGEQLAHALNLKV